MHRPDVQRGFTIIELMIVVAIIAVLAVVVIPSFFKESARGKAKSEVHPMFAELATRQDQYKVENNVYLDAPACPPSASKTGTDMTTAACAITTDEPWDKLRVQTSQSKLMCSYEVGAGTSAEVPTAHSAWPAGSWASAPASLAVGWYFVVAKCPDTDYFIASWDTKLRSKDGK